MSLKVSKITHLISLSFLLPLLTIFSSCTEEPAPIAVSAVTLDSTSITLVEGDSQTLTATISPSNAENQKVLWSSSNSSVATVKEGVVTAIKPGSATITVKSDDGGKIATCEVTVNAKVYPVTSIALDRTSHEMTEGDEFTLTATINPSNATNKNVSWKSSNTSVATVSNGKVTAVKAGSATITVTTEDGGKTATCEVTVNAKVYPVTGVSLDKTSHEMTEGDEVTLIATINPSNATNKNVSWKSSNTSVATVSNGKVTAVKSGTAIITVTTEDGGKTATCEVTVIIPVKSVSLNLTKLTLEKGNEETLIATINPTNASNQYLSWSSSNTSVATVSENGVVYAVNSGTATITVKTHNGKQATCLITVPTRVTGVTLNTTSLRINIGETIKLTATVKPSNATNKSVTWSSDNNEVALVDQNGNVKGLSKGIATIYVITDDRGKSATCTVEVDEIYVDLGLSVYWATCNLGADSPEKVGDKYAWGEVVSDPPFTDDSYKWGWRSPTTNRMWWDKYNTTDNKTVLDLADDAAYVNLGKQWRMPTISQCKELINNCEVTLVGYNGKYVYKFTSKIPGYTDKSIYLPFYVDSVTTTVFWTSCLGETGYQGETGATWTYHGLGPVVARYKGICIRPVRIK